MSKKIQCTNGDLSRHVSAVTVTYFIVFATARAHWRAPWSRRHTPAAAEILIPQKYSLSKHPTPRRFELPASTRTRHAPSTKAL